MKKVLVVDDDKSFLQSLMDGFKSYEDKFAIITAIDGIQATEILQKEEISLVLTDLKMPRMDGFALVAYLSSNYFDIPVIVMTAFGTPEMEDNLREMGTFQYIEKPIDFALLVEMIFKGLAGPAKGYITGVSLSSFLQLLELDKKTCTLTINAGSRSGTMYFRDGALLDATHNNTRGSDAAFEIVSWKNVEISIDNKCSVTEAVISESLGFILLEGSRRKDENDATSGSATFPTTNSMGSLDALNMEDLDLDFQKTPPTPVQSTTVTDNPMLAQFITMLSSFSEIESATISDKNGNTLHQAGKTNENIANFITYVAVAAEQIEIAIGASGRQYSIFTLSDSSKLIVLCGHEVVVGLSVGSSVFPASIADGLRPVLSRISLAV